MAAVWHVKGKDPFWAYRLRGQEAENFIYYQGNVAFYSPKKSIPAADFNKIIGYYRLTENDEAQVAKLLEKHQITRVEFYQTERDILKLSPCGYY